MTEHEAQPTQGATIIKPERLPILFWIIYVGGLIVGTIVIANDQSPLAILAVLAFLVATPAALLIIQQRLRKYWYVVVTLLIGVVAGALAILLMGFNKGAQTPDIALLSVRYMSSDYDPRIIDLRTVEKDGVPISKGVSLKLENLWVWASEKAEGYVVQAEVYANGSEYVGSSQRVLLQKGAFDIGRVSPTSYQHPTIENAWLVQDNWKELTIYLYLYPEGKGLPHVKLYKTSVKINSIGTSWVWDTPHARFVSITYSTNDGPQYVLDFRTAGETGIDAHPGDIITIHEVWYSSDADGGTHSIKLGGYLTADDYDPTTEQYSLEYPAQKGVHRFERLTPLPWQVRSGDRWWVVSLARADDRTLLDRYVIPLNAEISPGMTRVVDSVSWDLESSKYVDFETPGDFGEWEAAEKSAITPSTENTFTGNYALAVTTTSSASEDTLKVLWNHTVKDDAIVGQIYWPQQPGVTVVWAQMCAWVCVPIDPRMGRWNTFVMDISKLTFEDAPLYALSSPPSEVGLQVGLAGTIDKNTPYAFYIDGIRYYPRK